ncbi:MAG: hypothetical protein ABI304_12940 [Rudaea sp.]
MNESDKTSSSQPTLSRLYREHAQNDAQLPDADVLVSLALGDRPATTDDALAQVAASPLNGKLMRLTRDLQPLSIDLSMDLEALLGRSSQFGSHRQTHVRRRVTGTQPRWRFAMAAMAASVIAVAGLWTAHRLQQSTAMPSAIAVQTQADSDRIFAGFNEKAVATQNEKHGDEIFRGRFLPDEIFNANRHEG